MSRLLFYGLIIAALLAIFCPRWHPATPAVPAGPEPERAYGGQ